MFGFIRKYFINSFLVFFHSIGISFQRFVVLKFWGGHNRLHLPRLINCGVNLFDINRVQIVFYFFSIFCPSAQKCMSFFCR